jgi:hypothetical protein
MPRGHSRFLAKVGQCFMICLGISLCLRQRRQETFPLLHLPLYCASRLQKTKPQIGRQGEGCYFERRKEKIGPFS